MERVQRPKGTVGDGRDLCGRRMGESVSFRRRGLSTMPSVVPPIFYVPETQVCLNRRFKTKIENPLTRSISLKDSESIDVLTLLL